AVAWLVSAATLRAPYLALFRRALSAGSLDGSASRVELDLTSAAVLVEHLASRDPFEVIAAMNVLVWRKRDRLIPALVLYHTDERVLVRALAILSESGRTDFLRLAEPLLAHGSQAVRNAALRALALGGKLDVLERAAEDASARVRGYAAVHLASRAGLAVLGDHPGVAAAAFADGAARGAAARARRRRALELARGGRAAGARRHRAARSAAGPGADRAAARRRGPRG